MPLLETDRIWRKRFCAQLSCACSRTAECAAGQILVGISKEEGGRGHRPKKTRPVAGLCEGDAWESDRLGRPQLKYTSPT